MSSSALRVFAIILAIGAIAIGYFGYRASEQQPTPEPAHVEVVQPKGEPVVFAARDIPPGHVIQEEDLTITQVPARPVRSYSDTSAIIGLKPRTSISKGEMLLSSHFPSHSLLAQSLQPGERAIAVKVDEVIGVGGFIEPGDQVDVLLYLQADQELGPDSSAQVVLSRVRVLAFGNMLESTDDQTASIDAQPNKLEKAKTNGTKAAEGNRRKEEPTGKNSKTAVLAVPESETSKVMLAESSGRLRLALHGVEREESTPASLEPAIGPAAVSSPGSEYGQGNKFYMLKRELIQKGAVKQKTEVKSSKEVQEPGVIVYKGASTESWPGKPEH